MCACCCVCKKDIYRCLDHHNVTYISSRITFISSEMKFRPLSNGNANLHQLRHTNFNSVDAETISVYRQRYIYWDIRKCHWNRHHLRRMSFWIYFANVTWYLKLFAQNFLIFDVVRCFHLWAECCRMFYRLNDGNNVKSYTRNKFRKMSFLFEK